MLSPLASRANANPRVARAEARAARGREALVIVPRADIAAPILHLAIARVGPIARVDAWICGSSASHASFDLRLRGLAPPAWIGPLAGRGSARALVLSPGRLAARTVDVYLRALADAPAEPEPDAAQASHQTVLDVLRAHAPRWAVRLYS